MKSFEPVDHTNGELSPTERRALVRRVADQVGARVSARVQAALEAGDPLSEAAEKVSSSTEAQRALAAENERRLRQGHDPWSAGTRAALHDMVLDHIYGLGELEELWRHPEVEEIDVNGCEGVFVTFAGGTVKRWPAIAGSDGELLELIRRAARRLGYSEVQFDARHPKLDLPLPDGSRLFAVYGGRGTNGVAARTYLCIRRHRFLHLSADDLVDLRVWPAAAGAFVVAALRCGENLVVAGDHAAGKTTLLRGVIHSAVEPWERVVTVEAGITELGLHTSGRFENVAALFSRPPGLEGEGAVSVWELMEDYTRRLNARRVFVGELLGGEVGAVLDAFTGSTRGSACTIHARSARAALTRFEQYGLAAHPSLPVDAVRRGLAEASPIVVHLAGDDAGDGEFRRYCTAILEVTGLEDGHLTATELWALDDRGALVPRHALSVERRRRMARRGWDWTAEGWASELPEGDQR